MDQEDVMARLLVFVAILAGVWATMVGGWGLVNHGTLSTGELQSAVLWIGSGLFAAGLGLIAAGLARLLARDARNV